MAITCTANSLANSATCLAQQDSHLLSAMQVYLLCNIVTGQTVTCNLQTLATNSRCLSDSLSSHELEAIKVYLLCSLASGGGVSSGVLSGTGSPVGVVTPTSIGQLYTDTNGGLWMSIGLTSASWLQLI